VHAQALFDLGMSLLRRSCEQMKPGEVDADLYLDGLLIALLIASPLRISNFSSLEIGRHMIRGDVQWSLLVESTETKTARADYSGLPKALTAWLDFYVDEVRPALLKRIPAYSHSSTRLWIGLEGNPIGHQPIRRRIKRRTAAELGFTIVPHTFRKIAETSFMIERPEYAIYGPALLGHASPRTTERHYFAGQRQLALEIYHQELQRLVKGSADASVARDDAIILEKMKMLTLCISSGRRYT
jgi:integrase